MPTLDAVFNAAVVGSANLNGPFPVSQPSELFRIAHHSPGTQTQWFALSTLAEIKRLKVGVCADRELISVRGHGFHDPRRETSSHQWQSTHHG
jgi:hypothetical protein